MNVTCLGVKQHLPQNETHQCDASDVLGFHNIKHRIFFFCGHRLKKKEHLHVYSIHDYIQNTPNMFQKVSN